MVLKASPHLYSAHHRSKASKNSELDHEHFRSIVLIFFAFSPLYAQGVNNCLVVNPGKLTKAQAGGTYASLTVQPLKKEAIAAAGDKKMRHFVTDRTRTEIVRI